jgi:hypothetical protein
VIGSALALCILAGGLQVAVPAERFTLAWQHTVEKILWEEDYRLAGDWLFLVGARIRGSGAGMEPPDDAVLTGGVWHYVPQQRWHRQLVLARSEFGDDYRLCIDRRCDPLTNWLPRDTGPTVLEACRTLQRRTTQPRHWVPAR